jgi:hypothetical protein
MSGQVLAAVRRLGALPPFRSPEPIGNHTDFATAAAVIRDVATLPPDAQRRLVVALVRREFGDGVAAVLAGRRP